MSRQSGRDTVGFVVLLSSCDVMWDILKVVKEVMKGKTLKLKSLM